MATKVLPHDAASDLSSPSVLSKRADTAQGSSAVTKATNTQPGPVTVQLTNGAGGQPIVWFTPPLNAVTISGTITFNIRGLESHKNANAGPQVLVQRCDGQGSVISDVVSSAQGSEFRFQGESAANWTATPTSTTLAKGDRLKITLYGTDAGGTMASGYTFSVVYDGVSGATGDTYVQFTETLQTFFTSSDAGGGSNEVGAVSASSSLVDSGSAVDAGRRSSPDQNARLALQALLSEWEPTERGIVSQEVFLLELAASESATVSSLAEIAEWVPGSAARLSQLSTLLEWVQQSRAKADLLAVVAEWVPGTEMTAASGQLQLVGEQPTFAGTLRDRIPGDFNTSASYSGGGEGFPLSQTSPDPGEGAARYGEPNDPRPTWGPS